MRRLGGAVIHMQQVYDDVKFLVGNEDVLTDMQNIPVLPIFSDMVIDFFEALSKELLHDAKAKEYGDVIAYAFWIRRVALENEKLNYSDAITRLGKGVCFQITPSNIPVQFAVSMTYALISGNPSVTRLSNKEFEQVDIICNAIKKVLGTIIGMSRYVCVYRAPYDSVINRYMSEECDIRMIWGGDATIRNIREVNVKPRAIDLGFADRYSFAIIDADYYMLADEKYKDYYATDFYNDTYYTDQNACSSSRLVVWVGTRIDEAKEEFWKREKNLIDEKYEMNAISSSDKLLNIAVHSAEDSSIKVIKDDNLLTRVVLTKLDEHTMDHKGNSGLFMEYDAASIDEILPLMGKGCQTITYLGEMEGSLKKLVIDNGVRGVDRIVPLGHSMDLSFVWDGLDLPIELSRQVSNK